MARTSKILGKSKPGATTPTTLYTVPALKQADGVLYICNQSTDDTVRVALVEAAGSVSSDDYIAYDLIVTANATITLKFSLNAGEFISVYTTNGTCSFVATGGEYA